MNWLPVHRCFKIVLPPLIKWFTDQMPPLQFQLQHTDPASKARAGMITTDHVSY